MGCRVAHFHHSTNPAHFFINFPYNISYGVSDWETLANTLEDFYRDLKIIYGDWCREHHGAPRPPLLAGLLGLLQDDIFHGSLSL